MRAGSSMLTSLIFFGVCKLQVFGTAMETGRLPYAMSLNGYENASK